MPVEIGGGRYFSVREVAEACGVSRQSLYRWVAQGKVESPTYRLSRTGAKLFSESQAGGIIQFSKSIERVDEQSSAQMNLFEGS